MRGTGQREEGTPSVIKRTKEQDSKYLKEQDSVYALTLDFGRVIQRIKLSGHLYLYSS